MSKQAKTFTVKFCEALVARNAEQFSKDTELAISNAQKSAVALDAIMSSEEFKEIAARIIKGARIADAKQDRANFIAVKVLVKMVACMVALGQRMSSQLDPYSRTIGANLVHLSGISNKTNMVSLSRAVEYDELEQSQSIKRRYNCSVGTASTQASSSRMMLHYLQIATVSKGKRADVMTLDAENNARARAFAAMFTDKTVSEELTPAT